MLVLRLAEHRKALLETGAVESPDLATVEDGD